MAFDSFFLASLANEFNSTITDCKVVKIHQPDHNTIILRFHGKDGNFRLIVSANPQNARLHLTQAQSENPSVPPLFCMVLRKYLEGARLLRVVQTPFERVLCLDFLIHNDLGDEDFCSLIIEIMGKHSNVILVDKNGQIIDGLRRYSCLVSRHREVLPNRLYIAPPIQNKQVIGLLSLDELASCFFDLPPEQSLHDGLIAIGKGISPQIATELILATNLDNNLPVGEMGEYELIIIKTAADALYNRIKDNDFSPAVLLKQDGQVADFAAFPLVSWEEGQKVAFDSPSAAIDFYYQNIEEARLLNSQKHELIKLLANHKKRLDKKISLQEKDLTKALSGDSYKESGELLSANLFKIKRGMQNITLDSFYEDGKQVEVELNPALTPQENISRYFKLYSKAKNGRVKIEKHLANNLAERDYIESVTLAVEKTDNITELQPIRNELTQSKYLRPTPVARGGQKEKAKTEQLPPRSYTSSDGLEILVGRNNKQNDKLTLKQAAENDIWLHTKDIPGSHVIIRLNGQEDAPQQSLLEAAALAAYYSKASASDNVPVDYTRVNQVKKPAGALPGKVIYFQQKTLFVTPAQLKENK